MRVGELHYTLSVLRSKSLLACMRVGELQSTLSEEGGCVATLHCFPWVVADKWRRIEHVRPNVPLVSSETGETIWCALYHVEVIEHYSKFEVTGF